MPVTLIARYHIRPGHAAAVKAAARSRTEFSRSATSSN